jgi:hypothetical protein
VLVVRRRWPPTFAAVGVLVGVEGVGSLLYHGGDGAAAQLLHDAPLIGVLGFVAGWHVGRLSDRAGPSALAGSVAGLLAGVLASTVGATSLVAAVSIVVAGAAEATARRRGLRAVWTGPLLAVAGLAAAAWLAGSTGGPWCDPEAWWQPHALWHVLTALVVLAWTGRAASST